MDGRPGIGNKTTAGEEEKQTQLEKKKRTRAESIIAQSHSGYILGICVALLMDVLPIGVDPSGLVTWINMEMDVVAYAIIIADRSLAIIIMQSTKENKCCPANEGRRPGRVLYSRRGIYVPSNHSLLDGSALHAVGMDYMICCYCNVIIPPFGPHRHRPIPSTLCDFWCCLVCALPVMSCTGLVKGI